MSVLSDVSNAGNNVELVGGSETTSPPKKWIFSQKVSPVGTNARFAGDQFGNISDIDGDIMVVGTPNHPYDAAGDNALTNAGSVWIYRKNSLDEWVQELRLVPSVRATGDLFGSAVSISGNTIAIGAPGHSFDATGANQVDQAGAVYIYTYNGTAWTLQQKVVGTGVNARVTGDAFGTSLDLQVDRLAVGAPNQDYNASGSTVLADAGAVFVFDRTGSTWAQTARLVPTGTNARVQGDNLGKVVKLADARLFAQAPGQDFDAAGANSVPNAGAIYVWNSTTGSWVQEAKVVSAQRISNANFGNTMDAKGSTLVASSSGNKINEIFVVSGSTWTLTKSSAETVLNTKTRMLMHFEGNNGEAVNFVDEASTEALDVVTGTRSITLNGAASISTAVQKNGVGSLLLGQGNYASLARQDSSWTLGTSNFTLEWWEYRTAAASGTLLAPAVTVGGFNPSTGGGGILAGYSGNQLWISSGNVNGTWDIAGGISMGTVVLNTWSHIAIVRNGTSIKTYRDGVENAASVTTSLAIGGTGNFLFGNYAPTGNNYFFPGRIADFRFTAGVARYTAAFTPPATRLPYGSTTVDPSWNSVKTLFPFSDQFDYTTVTTTAPTTATQAVSDLPAIISTSQARYGSSALYLQGSPTSSSGLIVNSATRTALTNSNFTIECWVKPEPYAPQISLVMAANAVNNVRNIVSRAGLWSIGMYQENTTSTTYTPGRPSVSVLIGSQTRTLTASSTYQLGYNDWSHIAVVRNGDKLSLYVNGTQVATTSIGSTEAVPDGTSTTPIRFGYSGVMVADGMAGFVDEFRIIREAKYSGVTFAVPEAPFRFKESVMSTQGRGQSAAIYDESQILYGLPNMSGFEGYNVTYTAETIPTTAFPDLNVDNGGAVEVLTKKDGVWSTNTYLTAPGTTNARKANDRFGTKVRIKDSKILVTSPTNSQGLMGQRYLKETGAVYLFSGYGDYPKLSRKFVSATRRASAQYGSTAAFNGNTVVISSPDYSSTSINYYETLTIDLSGYSNVTRRINYTWQVSQVDHWTLDESTDVWSLAKTITPYSGSDTATTFASTRFGEYQSWPVPSYPNPASFLRYGETVAVSSSARFLISNPQASSGIAPWPTIAGGSVQGITISGTTYTETPFTVTGTPNIRTPGDQFGLNVATDGTRVIVGAPSHQYDQYGNNGIINAGATYSFTKNTTTGLWDMEQKILSPSRGGAGAEYFGTGLTIRSNNLVITAGDTRDPYGAAYLMTRKTDNTGWDAFKTYATTSVRTAAFVNDDNFAVGMPWRDLNPISGSDSGQAMLVSRYTNQPIAANLTYDVNDGKYGASAVFDGISTTINVAPTTAFNFASDFTIESRIKTTATAGVVATTRATTDHPVFYYGKYLIQLIAGKLVVTLEGTNVLTSAAVINDGNWHHFAISRNGTSIRLFIDGVISASATNSTALGADFINFGVNPVGGTRFAGKLENYRMYDKAKYTTAFDPLTVDYGENATTDTNYANLVLGMTLNNTVADFSKYWHAPTRDVDKIAPPGGANGRAAGDNFGYSVSLENNLLAVGTPKHTYDASGSFTAAGAGAVALWEYSTQANQWFYSTKVTPSGTLAAANANYGSSVDLATGGYMVVGSAAGKMQIHTQESPGNWSYQAESGSIYATGKVTFVNNALAVGGLPTQAVLGQTNVGAVTWMDRVVDTWSTGSTQSTLLASRILAVPATTNGRWATNQIDYNVYAMNGRKTNDLFGTAVAISGNKNFIAIGSPFHGYADNSATTVAGQGATYIYSQTGSTYNYLGKINRLGAATTNSGLGSAVAFNGTYLLVGAPSHSSFRGLSQVYVPTGSGYSTTWTLQAEHVGQAVNDKLGTSLALVTDSQLAVGIPGLDSTANVTDIGGWAWSSRINTTWSALSASQVIGGVTNGRRANDQFGTSVSITNGRLAVGAVNHSYTPSGEPTSGQMGGAVFTYNWTGANWIFEQKVKPARAVSGAINGFGRSVSITDNTLAIGSPSVNAGYVLGYSNGQWTNVDDFPGTESGETNSQSVAIVNDDYVLTGAPLLDGPFAVTDSGGFQTWHRITDGLWSAQGYNYQPTKLANGTVVNPGYTFGIKNGDAMGTSVAITNDYLAIGVPGKENALDGTILGTNTGVAYIYSWNPTSQRFSFDAQLLNPTNFVNDAFGTSMTFSDDRLTIGSLNASSSFNRGAFHVYDRVDQGNWTKVYSYVDRQSNRLGLSVAMPTKDTVVAGVPHSAGDWDDFQISQSGSFKYTYKHDGVWSATGLMVGGEGGIAGGPYPASFAGKGYATGGGGAGARGGAGGEAPVSDPSAQVLSPAAPGQGGTNLVPAGGQGFIGTGLTPGNATDADRGIAGQGGDSDSSASYDGQPARIVITWGSEKQVFDYTGADQEFVVPDGVTSVGVKLWGAGGGAGEGDRDTAWTIPGRGGGAGAVTGSLVVTPGETLTLMVGQGGFKGVLGTAVRPTPSAYGMGGRGGNYQNGNAGGNGGSGGNGGGLAGIFRASTPLAIAGGGGGSSGSDRTIVAQTYWDGLPGGTQTAGSQNIGVNKVSGYANGRSANDHFGYGLKLGQGYVVVGAPRHSFTLSGGALPANAGAVFLYRRAGQTWEYKGKLNAAQANANAYFGSSVTISDNHLAVGSSIERLQNSDLNLPVAGGGANGKGAVEVFRQTDQDVWVSDQRIDGETANNNFVNYGVTLVDDGKLVVGLPGSNTVGGASSVTASGAFRTYSRTQNSWNLSLENVTDGLSYGRFAQDKFGSAVKVAQDYIVVGAPGHSYSENGVRNIANMGAAFVFRLDANTNKWVYEKLLTSTSNTTGFGNIGVNGQTVMMGGTTAAQLFTRASAGNWSAGPVVTTGTNAAVALMGTDKIITGQTTASAGTGLQPTVTNAGAVQEYDFDGTAWSTGARLTIPGNSNGRQASDQFGYSVAMSSEGFIAIGSPIHAYTEAGNSRLSPGAVWTYNWQGQNYKFEKMLTSIKNQTGFSTFGRTLDVDGSTLITTNFQSVNHYAEIMVRSGIGNWTTVNVLDNKVQTVGQRQTDAMSIVNPNLFAQGISVEDGTGTPRAVFTNAGAFRTLVNNAGTFSEKAVTYTPGLANTRIALDKFATSAAMSKDYIVMGAPGHDFDQDGNFLANETGAVWLFKRNGLTFELVDMLIAPSAYRTALSHYGQSVAISSDSQHIVVGAPGSNVAFVYAFNGKTTTLMTTLAPTGNFGTDDLFGQAVAVNKGRIAIGAPQHNFNASGLGALNDAGAVYTYKLTGGATWTFSEKFVGFSNDKPYDKFDLPEDMFDVTGPNGRAALDMLGSAVAISNHRAMIVGGPNHDFDQVGQNSVTDAGAAWLKYLK